MANTYITHRRQLYMLPTKAGWMFSLIVFLLFLASVKFSHQATFLLTFLMCGFGLISSLHTQKNINNIRLEIKSAIAVYMHENAQFICNVTNPSNTKRHNIWIVCGDFHKCIDIEANTTQKVVITLKAQQRGLFKIPSISITSHFPIGILFGWSRAFQADASCIVYPQPKDILNEPESSFIQSDEGEPNTTHNGLHAGGEQIASLKAYQQGDRLRDIHWPSLAKSKQLVSKEYESNAEYKLVFNWHHVSSLTIENKLSQLAFWLLSAEKQHIDYQLSIPGHETIYSHGDNHLRQCLESIALWDINT